MLKLIYQLPNGKCIRLTVEEYLDLTEEDIKYIESLDFGESAVNPWLDSPLSKKGKSYDVEDYEENDLKGDHDFNIGFEDIDNSLDIPDVDLD